MKKENEEKPPISWEVKDPKPPVIQSGHMERRAAAPNACTVHSDSFLP